MPSAKHRRIAQAALAVVLIVAALATAIIATERDGQAQSGSAGITLGDIAQALRSRGLDVSPSGRLVRDPAIPMAGQELQIEQARAEVYLFASTADRVATEQRIIRDQYQQDLHARMPRITSVGNALIRVNGAGGMLAAQIQLAITALALATP